jgi:hypothetical protein
VKSVFNVPWFVFPHIMFSFSSLCDKLPPFKIFLSLVFKSAPPRGNLKNGDFSVFLTSIKTKLSFGLFWKKCNTANVILPREMFHDMNGLMNCSNFKMWHCLEIGIIYIPVVTIHLYYLWYVFFYDGQSYL